MKKYFPLAGGLLACIGCGVIVIGAGHPYARTQDLTNICSANCLAERIDELGQKTAALERSVDELKAQVRKSVKSGQAVTLRTQTGREGGCLTYIGPSGDRGGFVSWNANCSLGTLWTIN